MKNLKLFNTQTEKELEEFKAVFKNKKLAKGSYLFKEGEKGSEMYLIEKGAIEISIRQQDGKELPLVKIGNGGLVGEMAVFDNAPRSASAKAAEDTELWYLTGFDVDRLRTQGSSALAKFSFQVALNLCSRIRKTNERISSAIDMTKNMQKILKNEPEVVAPKYKVLTGMKEIEEPQNFFSKIFSTIRGK